MSSTIFAYSASDVVNSENENYSASIDEIEEAEEAKELEIPSKRIRTGFGYEKLPEGDEQPWKLIRRLQRQQDDILLGKPRAQDAYKLLLQHIGQIISGLDDSVWDSERNLDAMSVYILLGGKTELGYKALQKTKLDYLQKQPLEAAIAYAERDLARAYELMLKLDHLALPPSMSAQFALAKSMVVSSNDLDKALVYLREARRLAPGTLIEEGAVRRSIRISGERKAADDFFQLSRSYLRRFRKSHYFNDFLKNFGFALVRMPQNQEGKTLDFLKEVLSQVDASQQVSVAAYVSRYTAITGRRMMSLWASEMALGKLAEDSVLHKRMRLYAASAKIVDEENAPLAMATLEEIKADKLDRIDQEILKAAKVLGKQILQDSVEANLKTRPRLPNVDALEDQTIAEIKQDSETLNNEFLQRGNKLIATVQSALKKDKQ
jgi:chemotaxis protein MotC